MINKTTKHERDNRAQRETNGITEGKDQTRNKNKTNDKTTYKKKKTLQNINEVKKKMNNTTTDKREAIEHNEIKGNH